MLEGKNILITGGAGFMDSILAAKYLIEYILANSQYVTDETLANYQRFFPDQKNQ